MAEVATNNPAGRLYAFFDHMQQAAVRGGQNPLPLAEALSSTWGVAWPAEQADLMIRVADVVVLPTQIESRIRAFADDPRVDADLALEHSGSWRTALRATANLDNGLQTLVQHLNETNLYGLRMASSILARVAPEPMMSSDDVAALATSVADLLDDVLAADLDEPVRAFLLQQLRVVQDALARVHLRGVEALYEAIDQVVGASGGRHRRTAEQLRDHHPAWAERFWTVMSQLATALTIASTPLAMANNLHSLLPLPASHTQPAPGASFGPQTSATNSSPTPSPSALPAPAPHGAATP